MSALNRHRTFIDLQFLTLPRLRVFGPETRVTNVLDT